MHSPLVTGTLLYLMTSFMMYASARIVDDAEGPKEYCAAEQFDVTCGENEAIKMLSARYGRMQLGRCATGNYANSLGCYADVLQHMDTQCSGKQSCHMLIATLEALAQPCKKDFKSYLSATHVCLPVHAAHQRSCHNDFTRPLPAPSGIIAAGTIENTPMLLSCRWSIQVEVGQTVRLTLLTFDVVTQGYWSYPTTDSRAGCAVNIAVYDGDRESTVDVCHVKEREKIIYNSQSNEITLEMAVKRSKDRNPRFFLEYKAKGCPDILPDTNAHVTRTGSNHLHVRCNETNETWFLTCKNDKWIGSVGNCTGHSSWNFEQHPHLSSSFHRGWIVFAIIIGIVLGLLVGTSLLTIALMWRKRYREDTSSPQHNADVSTLADGSSMRFPALLHQEKALGDISEYTHVWEVHPPMLCSHDNALPHTCKMQYELNSMPAAQSGHQRHRADYSSAHSIYSTRSAASAGGVALNGQALAPPSRGGYDSHDNEDKIISPTYATTRNPTMQYYDLEPPSSNAHGTFHQDTDRNHANKLDTVSS